MNKRRKKNFIPSVILAIFSWVVLFFIIFFVDPQILKNFPLSGSYLVFFVFLFLSVFLSLSLILSHARRGLLLAAGLVFFFYLRLIGLGHLLNGLLIVSFLLVLELALSSK